MRLVQGMKIEHGNSNCQSSHRRTLTECLLPTPLFIWLSKSKSTWYTVAKCSTNILRYLTEMLLTISTLLRKLAAYWLFLMLSLSGSVALTRDLLAQNDKLISHLPSFTFIWHQHIVCFIGNNRVPMNFPWSPTIKYIFMKAFEIVVLKVFY